MRLVPLVLVMVVATGCSGTRSSEDSGGGTTAASTTASETNGAKQDVPGGGEEGNDTGTESPGSCSDQTTIADCAAHKGGNDIGEVVPDCMWLPTYQVVPDSDVCEFIEDGGYCWDVVFDDTCGVEGEQCDNGNTVGYATAEDGTVRIAAFQYMSYCGFPGDLQPCNDVSGGGSSSSSGSAGGDPPECACGCELCAWCRLAPWLTGANTASCRTDRSGSRTRSRWPAAVRSTKRWIPGAAFGTSRPIRCRAS